MTPTTQTPDTITFLQCKQPLVLTKTWQNGHIKDYDTAKHFTVHEKKVNSLEGLAKVLKGAAGRPEYAAIRGQRVIDQTEDVTRTMANFQDRPRHWVMFDIDGFKPDISPRLHLEAGVQQWIHETLPDAFLSVACYWQLSASAGHVTRDPDSLRAHVWFWLDKPVTGKQWKRWAERNNIKVDKSVFSPVQLHYTANPVIELGSDPYKERSGFLTGEACVKTDLCRFQDAEEAAAALNEHGDNVLRDPRTIAGLIGRFCTEVPILEVVTNILPDCFEPSVNESNQWDGRRLNFLQGSGGQGGAFIHSDGLHLVNMQTHAPDRTQSKALNAFDLVRVYRFADQDPADPFLRLDVTNMPSHKAMLDWAEEYLANRVATEALPAAQTGPDQPKAPKPIETHAEPLTGFPGPYPGIMTDAANAVLRSAQVKQPRLTVLGVLMGMAGSIGGHYKLASGMRLNLYGLNISPSGSGKDIVRRAAKAIALAAQVVPIGCPASGQGLQDAVNDQGATFVETDEAGHLFAGMNAKNAAAHSIETGKILLELFSAGFGPYATRVKAKSKDGPASRVIQSPAVSFFGSTTAERLATALTEDNVTDGLIGRFLFAAGSTQKQQKFNWDVPEFVVPESVNKAGALLAFAPGGDKTIAHGPGVAEQMRVWAQEYWSLVTGSRNTIARAFATRSIEKIERVAGVLAVWESPEAPVMTVNHIAWARQFVDYSNVEVCRFVDQDMGSDSETVVASRKLLAKIREMSEESGSAEGWVKQRDLMRRCRFDIRTMKAALETLEESGMAETHAIKNANGPATKPTMYIRECRT